MDWFSRENLKTVNHRFSPEKYGAETSNFPIFYQSIEEASFYNTNSAIKVRTSPFLRWLNPHVEWYKAI